MFSIDRRAPAAVRPTAQESERTFGRGSGPRAEVERTACALSGAPRRRWQDAAAQVRDLSEVLEGDRGAAAAAVRGGWGHPVGSFALDPPGAFGAAPVFKDAIAQLRDAETAFRTRTNPAHVLVHCYKALEGMAKIKAPNNVGAGFQTLLAETFPGEPNKAELINGVIQGVKDFAHFGRHEDVPPVNVSFDEARFILTSIHGADAADHDEQPIAAALTYPAPRSSPA